ncbi:hypothetical protein FRC08_007001, partial [Ceratobasidium sp. 394]
MPPPLDSPPHFVSDPSWGPPLHEYLTRPEANLLFSHLPEEPTILRALDDFFHRRDDVTYKTLETIMTIIYRPRMMRLLLGQRAVTSCISLLENYVARGNSSTGGFFEHAFGFLGLHVLALILQVGILRYFDDWLERLPPILDDNTEYPWNIKAPILFSECLPILEDYLDESSRDDFVSSGFFGWYGDARSNEHACLPLVGGFTFRHVEFLLQQLFDGRFMFLQCCVQTKAPAWFILIYVMQCHFNKRSLDDGRPNSHYDTIGLRRFSNSELAHRYSLVSGLKEEPLMEQICAQCTPHAKPGPGLASGPVFVINFEDAQLMQRAYTHKFYPNKDGTHKRSLLLMHELSYFIRDNVGDHVSLGLNLGETTIEIIWDVLCCADQDTRWTFIDRFINPAFGALFLMARHKNPSITSRVVSVLHKLDVVNMFGRYLLLPSYVWNCLPGIVNEGKFLAQGSTPKGGHGPREDGLTALASTAIILGGAFTELGVPRIFDDGYSDWYKVQLFLLQEMHKYKSHSYLQRIAVDSELAWRKLGLALGFIKKPNQFTPVQQPLRIPEVLQCKVPSG